MMWCQIFDRKFGDLSPAPILTAASVAHSTQEALKNSLKSDMGNLNNLDISETRMEEDSPSITSTPDHKDLMDMPATRLIFQ